MSLAPAEVAGSQKPETDSERGEGFRRRDATARARGVASDLAAALVPTGLASVDEAGGEITAASLSAATAAKSHRGRGDHQDCRERREYDESDSHVFHLLS